MRTQPIRVWPEPRIALESAGEPRPPAWEEKGYERRADCSPPSSAPQDSRCRYLFEGPRQGVLDQLHKYCLDIEAASRVAIDHWNAG